MNTDPKQQGGRRKPHSADLAAERDIAAAERFIVWMRVSPAERFREEHPSLAAARAAAARLDAAHGRYGRRSIIYACQPNGAPIPVPDSYGANSMTAEADYEVFRDLAVRDQDSFRVRLPDGRITSPSFNSKGAALAYIDILREGRRKPELEPTR